MKKKWTIFVCGLLLLPGITSAQMVSADSINTLNREREKLTIQLSLNEDKLKLAGMENELAAQTQQMQEKMASSQQAVDKNQEEANTLSEDSLDKDKAKAAKKQAGKAEHSVKDVKKIQDKIDKLNRHIEDQKKKVSEHEQQLIAL